jgi:hypothetical protein
MATEQAAPGRSSKLTSAVVVTRLLGVLGEALVAVIAGVDDAEIVRQWARGEWLPPPAIVKRLRATLDVVELLLEREGAATVRAWWMGMNPDLGDEAPALVVASRPTEVWNAALAHLAS